KLLEGLRGAWKERLRQAGRPGDLAEALWGLESLAPEHARKVVTEDQEFWKRRLLSAITEPATVVELLTAIDNAHSGTAASLIRSVEDSGYWRSFLLELKYEQNPRLQGDCYRRLARLGYFPELPHRRSVYEGKWKSALSSVSNPAALYSLLQTFASWDPAWGREAAGRIDLRRVTARLEHGAREDLAAAGALIGTLVALEKHPEAEQLFEAFRRHMPSAVERMGLTDALKVMPSLREWNEDLARAVVVECLRQAQSVLGSRFVVDANEKALAIGWAAFHGKSLGRELVCDVQPPLIRRLQDARLRLWAVGWMAERPWVREVLEAAIDEIEEPPRKPWSAAGVLAVCATHGLLGELAPEGDNWRHAVDAAPIHLVPLLEAAVSSPELKSLLQDQLGRLRVGLDSRALRAHPGRRQVSRLLARVLGGDAGLRQLG
ncbi:MAG TPA: hypothetical protein VHM02_06440, partial [Thermoanaerobaculia bacterium]|nr:hypothetical protein [Thermoanaerobaculia bacterium]